MNLRIVFISVLFFFISLNLILSPSVAIGCMIKQGVPQTSNCPSCIPTNYQLSNGVYYAKVTPIHGIFYDLYLVCENVPYMNEIRCDGYSDCDTQLLYGDYIGYNCYGEYSTSGVRSDDDIFVPFTDADKAVCQFSDADVNSGYCNNYFGTWDDWGYWDPDQKGCVKCLDNFQWKIVTDSEVGLVTDTQCEYACGADSGCDEELSGSWCDWNVKKTCSSSCGYSGQDCAVSGNVCGVINSDFIMGAATFVVYQDVAGTAILKNNGFNWLRVLFNDDTYAGNGVCGGDYNNDGKEDHIDCLIVIESVGRNQAYWNFNYDILLEFKENYIGRENQLKELAKKVVTDIRNYSKYKNQIDGSELINTRPWPYVGFYEIGGEIDMPEGFAGAPGGDWSAQAPLLKATIQGVREADPSAKIILHLADSTNPAFVENFLNIMGSNDVDFDYIGFTFYPSAYSEWNNDNLAECVDRAANYGKKTIILEFGFPTSYWCEKCEGGPEYYSDECICTDTGKVCNYCGKFNFDAEDVIEDGVTYTLTEQGQAAYLRYELNFFKNDPDILGVVYSLPLEPDSWCGWPGAFNRSDATLKPGIKEIKVFMSGECKSSCSYDSDCNAGFVCDSSNNNCLWCWYEHNAKIVDGTTVCESDCGAHPECDEKEIWSTFCVGNVKKICDGSCNSVSLDYCDYGCSDGECVTSTTTTIRRGGGGGRPRMLGLTEGDIIIIIVTVVLIVIIFGVLKFVAKKK